MSTSKIFKDKFIIPAYAMAKGVGATASFTMHVRVDVRSSRIMDRNFSVLLYFPPAIKKKVVGLTGVVTFRSDGDVVKKISLAEEWYPTMSSGRSLSRVLVKGSSVTLRPGAQSEARIAVNALVKPGGGAGPGVAPIMPARQPVIDLSI